MFKAKDSSWKRLVSKDYWLGLEQSAVNINRFWLYLGSIGFVLCLTCLVKSIETIGNR